MPSCEPLWPMCCLWGHRLGNSRPEAEQEMSDWLEFGSKARKGKVLQVQLWFLCQQNLKKIVSSVGFPNEPRFKHAASLKTCSCIFQPSENLIVFLYPQYFMFKSQHRSYLQNLHNGKSCTTRTSGTDSHCIRSSWDQVPTVIHHVSLSNYKKNLPIIRN